FREFIVCLGYRGYVIKEYFANLYLHSSDVTIRVSGGEIEYHRSNTENWTVSLVETGLNTMTGGRLKRIKDFVGQEDFFMTYGDGVSDVNINDLLRFHNKYRRMATVTAVAPPGRFGVLELQGE